MKRIDFSLENMPERNEGLTLALGNFDGIHQGHQRLFVRAMEQARADAAALFFETPFGEGKVLTSVDDKCRFALSSRLDAVYVLHNDASLFALSPEEFMTRVLLPLGVKRVVVGEDFRFGHKASGAPKDLEKYFEVTVEPLYKINDEKVASSSIKGYLAQGEILKATEALGHTYEVQGTVVEGFHNGSKLGYPTANIALLADYVLPKCGVYAGVCYISGIAYRAIINVGRNPTIGLLNEDIIEAHLLDYDADCYGKRIYCSFLAFLREERRFESLDELKEQLSRDEFLLRDVLA